MTEKKLIAYILGLVIGTLFIHMMYKIERKNKNRKAFNEVYPVGSTFQTFYREQEFPYGTWELVGINTDNSYIFERIK